MTLRIMWHSNSPLASTGYSIQTRRFVPQIKRLGHEIAISAFYGVEGAIMGWIDGIPLYPKAFDLWGNDVMSTHAQHFRADILITLMDAWVVQPHMMLPGTRWVPWFPIDSSPIPQAVERHVVQAYERIVMSRFGEAMCRDAGLDCHYVPHGVPTDVFHPVPQEQARQQLGMPDDCFLVSMVAANKGAPSRKAFMPQLRAFRDFKQAHPDHDIRLYLHTTKGDHNEYGGENLPEFLKYLGLTYAEQGSVDRAWADVVFCDQYFNILGFNDDYMRTVYSASDLLMSVSMGEGFGVPILEAQSCGCPVLVGDWTAMSELCWAGWRVPAEQSDPIWTGVAAYQFVPRIAAITEQLEAAFDALANEKYRKKLRLKARNGALDYDVERVTDRYWKPVLGRIEERIKAEQRTLVAVGDPLQVTSEPEGDAA